MWESPLCNTTLVTHGGDSSSSCPLPFLHHPLSSHAFSPRRDQNKVLAEDREKLRVLQPLQPWFSQEQREELAEVHPWIKQHAIPQEIDTQVSLGITHCEHFLFSFPMTVCLMRCCLSQGCVSCSSGAGMSHPPHPAAPDSSSPLESPQHDPIGPVVDTWETLTRNHPPSGLQCASPVRNLNNSHRASLLTSLKEWIPVL